MRKNYTWALFIGFCFVIATISCSRSDDAVYVPVEPVEPGPEAAVSVDLTQVPYLHLSEYHFFQGAIKNQEPNEHVLPYQPASSLFSDYAHKRRFVWMPDGTKAAYSGDSSVLDLPVGAAIVKTFYYENVQNIAVPGQSRIIETRVMIRKADGWIFADYVWNDDQSDAVLNLDGSDTPVEWIDENGVARSVNYHIPNLAQCIVCHKFQDTQGGGAVAHLPIGIKPQNLNFNYNYGNAVKNQLAKWIEYGYLDAAAPIPAAANTVVNYDDQQQPIDKRVRAYFDANCSHCHSVNRHCDYRPMRFAYFETAGPRGNQKMGVCVNTQDMQGLPPELNKIVAPQNPAGSMLFYRMNTLNPTYRMPLHGRTLIHEEGVALIEAWINNLPACD